MIPEPESPQTPELGRRCGLSLGRSYASRLADGRDAVESGGEDVLDRVGEDELELLPRLARELLEVGLVLPREDDLLSPARWAASTFSRTPPIASTCPVSVISPVIADLLRDGARR